MKRMNKFFTLVFAALAFTAFTACNDDKTGKDGDEIAPAGEAWTTLRIINPNTNLGRALNTPDQYPSTSPEETEIKEVRAIFFNGYDATSVVTDVKKITLNASNISDAFLVADNSKSILIVINPPSNFPDFTKGQTFATVNAAIKTIPDIYTDKQFMMTNAKGGLEPSLPDGSPAAGLPLFTSKNDAELPGNALKINVDRVVAKVRVFVTYASTEAAVIENASWVVNLTNKWYYPVSERTQTFLGTATPFDEYGLGSYRKDPNFDHTNIPYPSADFDEQYNFYTQADVDNNSIVWIAPCHATDPNQGGKPQYCAENTQRKEDNTYAYTTQVLLKATYLPKYKKFDGSMTDVQEGNKDWMDINGGFYTYAVMMEWIEGELTNKYIDQNPAGYVTNVTTAFNSYLKYLQGKGAAVQEVVIPDVAGVRTVAEIVQDFENQKAGVVAHGADVNKDVNGDPIVKYYKSGISYYAIAIKHDNDTDNSNNEFGEFGVVRNSMYDIAVKSFNNPGYPIVIEPDPDKKDEFEAWLAIEIGVNPWTWYVQEENL